MRDVLLGIDSTDWDFATRARPEQVRRVFKRTVPIGIEHGTVGVLARDGTLYEVTTFRRDVETHGRHATVEFADRLEDDLARAFGLVLVLEGALALTIGGEPVRATPGTIVRMPGGVPHALEAAEPTRMLLVMLRRAQGA